MAKYKEREVRAVRIYDPSLDTFEVYSDDYKGDVVKRSELTFTEEEKNELVKQDTDHPFRNKDSYKTYTPGYAKTHPVEVVKTQPQTIKLKTADDLSESTPAKKWSFKK